MAINYGDLPFKEAIQFFRGKINLPTETWTDIWQSAHDKAFVVAGANTADLVNDFRAAVDKAIAKGTTLETFRQDFDAIIKKHGWSYNGGRGWRTRVIYETNLRTAHMAGRYQQIQQVAKTRPYLQYKHADYVSNPRPEHQSWDGLILKHDDPFWQTHFPPNGWGCKCRVNTLSDKDMIKLGKTAPDKAPPINLESQLVGQRSGNPQTVEIPKGIDPGWAYAPGANAQTELRELIDKKLFNLSAPIGALMYKHLSSALALQRDLAWKDKLDEWLSNPYPKRETFIVGALSPETLKWLKENKYSEPLSAEIAISDNLVIGKKQSRHEQAQNGLTDKEWRAVPTYIREGDIYLHVSSSNLIFVSDGIGGVKLAVVFEPKRNRKNNNNRLVSGFRTSASDIADLVKRG